MSCFFLACTPPTFTAQQKGVSFKSRRFYKKPAAVAIDTALTLAMKPFRPAAPLAGPLCVEIAWIFPYLKKDPKDVRDAGFLIRSMLTPDLVNAEKAVVDLFKTDSLRFIVEDAHIAEQHLYKFRGPPNTNGIAVRITSISEVVSSACPSAHIHEFNFLSFPHGTAF